MGNLEDKVCGLQRTDGYVMRPRRAVNDDILFLGNAFEVTVDGGPVYATGMWENYPLGDHNVRF